MADIDATSSTSSGATLPPSPSPATAPNPVWDAPKRVNHVQPLPIPSSVYRAIANLNRTFEEHTRNLKALQEFNTFPEEHLLAWGNMLCRLQAESSLRLIDTIHDRLMNNALYYDRLCWTRERELKDPDDCLFEAERRKQEIAQEQQHREQESEDDT